jgi:ubiquinone/menaquinone biosynthesis C-methylase UbiE
MATADPNDLRLGYVSVEAAAGWRNRAASRAEFLGPATVLLLDLAELRPGDHVLDVAAGTGEQTVLAARRVAPTGSVLAVDVSGAMLTLAAEAATAAQLHNIETREMDAQQLDLPEGTFDAAISRNGLQLMQDRAGMLHGMWRALKPGGRLAILVFGALEHNPYFGIPHTVLRRHAAIPARDPHTPGQFGLGDAEMLATLVRDAGFREVRVEVCVTHRRFGSVEEAVESLYELSRPNLMPDLIAALSEAEREVAWAEIRDGFAHYALADGVDIPGEALVVGGIK